MRNLFLLIALATLSTATAQKGDIVKDSVYNQVVDGKYFQVHYTEYENGDNSTERAMIGDGSATAVFNQAQWRFLQSAKQMATDAAIIINFTKRINDIVREGAAVKAVASKSPLDTIQSAFIAPFLLPGWTMKENGNAARDAVFSINQNGQFKAKIGSDSNKNALLLGAIIRMNNYPSSGIDTDLFQMQNGSFKSLDGHYILRTPTQSQTKKKKK